MIEWLIKRGEQRRGQKRGEDWALKQTSIFVKAHPISIRSKAMMTLLRWRFGPEIMEWSWKMMNYQPISLVSVKFLFRLMKRRDLIWKCIWPSLRIRISRRLVKEDMPGGTQLKVKIRTSAYKLNFKDLRICLCWDQMLNKMWSLSKPKATVNLLLWSDLRRLWTKIPSQTLMLIKKIGSFLCSSRNLWKQKLSREVNIIQVSLM